jgi:photosystem II stability/assembly factor-like uncharacterized protein
LVKIKENSTGRIFGLACLASCLAIQTWPGPKHFHRDSRQPFDHDCVAADSIGPVSPLSDRVSVSKERAAEAYAGLPIAFEANYGQADRQVKYLSRSSGCNLYLTANQAVVSLRQSARFSSHGGDSNSANAGPHSCTLRMKLAGASDATRITGLNELPGKTNYFIGNDPKKWRTNVPSYSSVKFQNVYPGVDVLYYGNRRDLEYDFIVAPGASFKPIRLTFEGAQRIRLDASGDLLIDTSIGEIRQRKPVIYQQASGIKRPISGGYVMRGEREVGFEVSDYDRSQAIVIDPVFVYSTSIGGFYNDNANAVAVDAAGNAYITGMTTSVDFPTVNPFQPNLKIGVTVGIPSDAFVTKLSASGAAVLYSTYLGGGRNDTANAIAVDDAGNVYLTGYTASDDFPTTPDAFQTKASDGGDAFVTKLSLTGNDLVYSTRLGGQGPSAFSTNANVGRGIAVDAQGNAYVAGYTFSARFPLKKPLQGAFNQGVAFDCCGCLYGGVLVPPLEDAFVTKLNPSGAALVYSTYLGGTGQDEALAIALDSSGSVYLTGRTCSPDFPNSTPGGASDAFLVKLGPSGREFMYATRLGGSGDDVGNGVAVDSSGSAYITGQTNSVDLPTTSSALQRSLGGSVSYKSNDGGGDWQPVAGLPNSTVNVLAIDPTIPLKIYAGLKSGLFTSTDGGNSWRKNVLPGSLVTTIAIDPKNPSTVYTDGFKSTDGGLSWAVMRLPVPGVGCGSVHLTIDPTNTATLYIILPLIICGDTAFPPAFFKSTDGGNTWNAVRNGTNRFTPTSVVIDPKNSSTLYAIDANLYKSTDAGSTWRVPYEGSRNFFKLAIDPIDTSTLYLSEPVDNFFRSTDGGTTFTKLGLINGPINELLVDPINSSTLYAATGRAGQSGGVLKSTNSGQTWHLTDLVAIAITALAIDPIDSSRLYAGASFDVDGFVAKSNPAGGAFAYSTYLGSRSVDTAASIGVDEVGNVYVAGSTFSDRFPSKDALQPTKPSGPFDTAIFTTTISATGSVILFSTYVGGSDPSFGSGIAVDPAGKVCIAGTTGTFQPVPTAISAQSVHGGFDALVIKIVSPPRIAGASVSGKNLIVTGEGFDKGAAILVDGAEQRTRNDESKPATVLIGKKTAKNLTPGQRVSVQVRNSDGLQSESFSFTRLP